MLCYDKHHLPKRRSEGKWQKRGSSGTLWPRSVRPELPTLPLSFQTDRLCAFTQILFLNEYANLLSMWKSPATDYKKNKEETLRIPWRLLSICKESNVKPSVSLACWCEWLWEKSCSKEGKQECLECFNLAHFSFAVSVKCHLVMDSQMQPRGFYWFWFQARLIKLPTVLAQREVSSACALDCESETK